jgi:hypothetical protein
MTAARFAGTAPLPASVAAWAKLWELSVTAPMVIGYRLAGMAPVGTAPNARQRRELGRMGQEKVDAFSEAALAAGQRLFEANLALGGLFWRQVWSGPFSPAMLAGRLSSIGPRLMMDNLTPYHRRVVANNRRLGGR